MDTTSSIAETSAPSYYSNYAEILEFNRNLFEVIKPFIAGRSIEINSGSGLISSILAGNDISIHLSDPNKQNRDHLRITFANKPAIKSIQNYDFENAHLSIGNPPIPAIFNTAILVNVIENGFPSKQTIINARNTLVDRGLVITILPISVSMYNGLEDDSTKWHFFNQKEISNSISNQLELIKLKAINVPKSTTHTPTENFGLSAIVIARKQVNS